MLSSLQKIFNRELRILGEIIPGALEVNATHRDENIDSAVRLIGDTLRKDKPDPKNPPRLIIVEKHPTENSCTVQLWPGGAIKHGRPGLVIELPYASLNQEIILNSQNMPWSAAFALLLQNEGIDFNLPEYPFTAAHYPVLKDKGAIMLFSLKNWREHKPTASEMSIPAIDFEQLEKIRDGSLSVPSLPDTVEEIVHIEQQFNKEAARGYRINEEARRALAEDFPSIRIAQCLIALFEENGVTKITFDTGQKGRIGGSSAPVLLERQQIIVTFDRPLSATHEVRKKIIEAIEALKPAVGKILFEEPVEVRVEKKSKLQSKGSSFLRGYLHVEPSQWEIELHFRGPQEKYTVATSYQSYLKSKASEITDLSLYDICGDKVVMTPQVLAVEVTREKVVVISGDKNRDSHQLAEQIRKSERYHMYTEVRGFYDAQGFSIFNLKD